MYMYVTRSMKRGHFPQNFNVKLDVSVDSMKLIVQAFLCKRFNTSVSLTQVLVLRVSYSLTHVHVPWFRDTHVSAFTCS